MITRDDVVKTMTEFCQLLDSQAAEANACAEAEDRKKEQEVAAICADQAAAASESHAEAMAKLNATDARISAKENAIAASQAAKEPASLFRQWVTSTNAERATGAAAAPQQPEKASSSTLDYEPE